MANRVMFSVPPVNFGIHIWPTPVILHFLVDSEIDIIVTLKNQSKWLKKELRDFPTLSKQS